MMQYQIRPFLVACLVGALTACTAGTAFVSHDDVKTEIDKDFSDVIKSRDVPDKTPFVRMFNHVYITHLTKEDVKRPFWYNDLRPLSASKDITLLRLLQETFDGVPVNFQFQEGVDKNKKVTTPNLNFTYGETLDYISSLTGYSHSIQGRSIDFKKFTTEVFSVRQLPGSESFSVGKKGMVDDSGDSVGEKTVSGNFISGSDQEYSIHTGSIDVMADIKLGVDSILGCFEGAGVEEPLDSSTTGITETVASRDGEVGCKQGASSKVLRSSSAILVRAIPSQMNAVRKFINDKNSLLTRQISLQVSFINIEFSDENQMNVDFELAASSISQNINLASTTSAAASGIIGGLDASGIISIESTDPRMSGSKAFLEALSMQGAVSKKTFPRVIATHNHVGVVGNIDRVNYISARESLTSTTVGAQTSIIQSEAETGFMLYALPNIGNTDAIIKISTSQSSLLGIETKGEDDQMVESPIINDKLFNTTIRVEYGKPILIAGLSDTALQILGSESGLLPTGVARSSTEKTVETILMIEAIKL